MDTQTTIQEAEQLGATRHMPRGVYKGTREEWLQEAMCLMGEWINEFNASPIRIGIPQPITQTKYMIMRWGNTPKFYKFDPSRIQVSCSLQGSGMTKAKSAAHIHYAHATGNNKHEIRMSVEIGGRKLKSQSIEVAHILLHEMIHSCAVGHGHKRAFKHIAQGVGLVGKMTSTTAGEIG